MTGYDGEGPGPTRRGGVLLGVAQWQTTTSYPGMDQIDTVPPSGGVSTEVVTNSRGETSQSVKDYASASLADTT